MGEPSTSWQNFNFRDDDGSAQGMQALRLLLAKLQEAQANPCLKPSVNNLLMTEDLMLTSTQRLPSSVAPMHLEGGEGVPVMHGPMQANVVPHPLQGPLQTDGAKKKQYHGQERHVGKIREEGDFHDDDDEPPSRSRHKKRTNERRTKRSRRNSSGGSSSSSQSGRSSHGRFPKKGRKLLETSSVGARPTKLIEIYEFEGCPFCRKVREIVSILDLDVLFYPCPKDGPNFRPKAIQLGGKKQFPYMVDPNTGVSMYESDAIIKYLVEKYGNGKVPLVLSLGFLTTLTAGFAMIARMGKGSKYVPSKLPEKPLELWAYEASPFCKIVREVLVELELPHIYRSTARGSGKRLELSKRAGNFQVPYLEDPNTGVKMFESASIIEYLQQTYALPT
ncbi:hypothetical protein L7F22_048669 [Adiantum nelumboides]|nr:hypothetical protein [Adiantum nelumboides]